MIHLNSQQVEAGEHLAYDPETHDFLWNEDYSEVYVLPLKWHDGASYAEYQGDRGHDVRGAPPGEE